MQGVALRLVLGLEQGRVVTLLLVVDERRLFNGVDMTQCLCALSFPSESLHCYSFMYMLYGAQGTICPPT